MDKEAFKSTADRLREVNDVVKDLDEAIRLEAFALLRPYAAEHPRKVAPTPEDPGQTQTESQGLVSHDEARAFLEEHHSDKPAENVKAIAALFYSRFGAQQFTAQEIVEVAHEAGVTVPSRVDVTLGSVTANKKALFSKVRSGVYKPSVHGEKYFKENFGVIKGTGRRPDLRS
jgi:hypothetical protein